LTRRRRTSISQESKELKRSFSLAQSTNLDLEKKVAELAEALKVCQDEKKVAEAALELSKKELEKVQKTHEDDLSLIENLCEKHDRASKVAEDLRVNNANLAKTTLAVAVTVAATESTLTPAASRSASRAGEAPAASAPSATRSSPATVVEPKCTAVWGRSGAVEKDPVEG
jgi:chromosome segregation ATPase